MNENVEKFLDALIGKVGEERLDRWLDNANKFLDDPVKVEKVSEAIASLAVGMGCRRNVTKALVASGVEKGRAKKISRGVGSAAWLIGSGVYLGFDSTKKLRSSLKS